LEREKNSFQAKSIVQVVSARVSTHKTSSHYMETGNPAKHLGEDKRESS